MNIQHTLDETSSNKGKIMRKAFLISICILLYQPQVFGYGAILHIQGEEGDREAYFTDVRNVTNRTPVSLNGGPEINEIGITAVYENANKPEWVYMNVQFECPSGILVDKKGDVKVNPHIIKAGDSVKFRIGANSYKLRRSDLKTEPLPQSEWKTSNAPMLSKAGAIACNYIEFDRALFRSISNGKFDHDKFGKDVNDKFALPDDMVLLGINLSSEFLDYSWSILWWEKVFEGKRPNPSGKWTQKASKADKEAAIKKVKDAYSSIAPQLEAAKKNLEAGVDKQNAEFEFRDKAAKLRQGRKQNKFEVSLNNFWIGKKEQEVVNTMGNPEFSQAGDTRFLTYTQYFDNRGTAVMKSGAVVTEGVYAECYSQFAIMQDKKGIWRVADVKVRADGNHLGMAKSLCYDVVKIHD